ncbi:MAG: hypothetical protein WKF84_15105 [Pyrinomonadaceae bacterium]
MTIGKLYTKGNPRNRLLQAIGPLSPTVLYRRSALERHGWNEKVQLEDYELYLRLSADGTLLLVPRFWQHGGGTGITPAKIMR